MKDRKEKYSKYHVLEPILPNLEDWPIFKLSEDREAFIEEIKAVTGARIRSKYKDRLGAVLAKVVYLERNRIKEEPWKVDPSNEMAFYDKIRKRLAKESLGKSPEESRKVNEELLEVLLDKYAEEIVGTFKIKTFLFARKFLTRLFNRLLNSAASRNFERLYGSRYRVTDNLLTVGPVDKIRSLMKKGTVVIVPTHFSNIDSIIIGYYLDAVLGLPAFAYGAGLNLYNTGYTAYFMNRLGAYRVDRRKKNALYLATLKENSNLSLQRGVHSLFFPGGTRSRSGSLEKKLKLGLLSTAVEAQRVNFQKGKDEKIFIVPMVLNYHFVLEAPFLIENHLKSTGREFYIKTKDGTYSKKKMGKFLWQVLSKSSEITFSFGEPMDVLGNVVDENGVSQRDGNTIDVKEYFYGENKEITGNYQRESEYTRLLAEKIVKGFHENNVVLSSQLVAFAVFNILKAKNTNLDIYGILRLPSSEITFTIATVTMVIDQLKDQLFKMEMEGKIILSKEIALPTQELIENGVKNLGLFHSRKPLKFLKNGQIMSEDLNTLYFYHNRLENYELDKVINIAKQDFAYSE